MLAALSRRMDAVKPLHGIEEGAKVFIRRHGTVSPLVEGAIQSHTPATPGHA